MAPFASKRKLLLCLVPALVSAGLDLSTKALALRHLSERGEILVTGFFNLVLAFNPGGAFSLFSSASRHQGLIMAGVALLSMIPLGFFFWQAKEDDRSTLIAIGAVVGGAVGNIFDRLRHGAVVDFLDFHYGASHWPAFNVADVAICAGLGFLILFVIGDARKNPGRDGKDGKDAGGKKPAAPAPRSAQRKRAG